MDFTYTVKNAAGRLQTGVIEAGNTQSAVSALQAKRLVILKLEEASAGPLFAKRLKIFERVKTKDLVSFVRQLSTLVSAKVPLVQSLQALAKQTENAYFRDIIFGVASDVEGGDVFSRALGRHPKVFSDFFVNMVKAGEVSGTLENTLLFLADYLERQYYLVSKVRGAMMYPAFILSGFIIVGMLMMVMVIPNLTGILKEAGKELPFSTKMVIGISDLLRGWWWLVMMLLVAAPFVFLRLLKKSPAVRYGWDAFKLKAPIFGKIFKKIYVARLADNLSTLIQGGLHILEALQITGEVVGNLVVRDIIWEAKEEVRVGGTVSAAFEKHKEIPSLVSRMIATGEQAGALDDILKKLARFYSREVDNTVETLSQLIEPILIVVLGGGVAVLVASILMPIYNIAGGG